MDFIEEWLGVRPDGGNGALEVLYIVVIALVIAAVVVRRQRRRRADE